MNGETLIDLYLQDGNPARPIPDVHIPAGSAAAFRMRRLVVDDETTVTVQATNADGTMLTAEAERDGEDFLATFPAANFAAYGVVENGFRVVLVRDGSTFQAAVGNLYIDAQTANAVPGDPEGHAITREELANLFDDLELADAATQKEVRVALKEIIQKLKGIAGAVAAIAVAVLPAFGDVTPSTVWEDMPPTSVVSHVVRSFAQPTSLAPATNYVDIKTGEIVSNTYTKAETDARIAELAPRTSLEPATNYTDNAVEIAYHDAVDYIERVARRILTTNDVCSIVTNETEGAFGAWASSDEDEYPEYGLVWTGSDEDDPDGFWFFDMYPFERNLGGNYYSTELTMEVDEEQIVKFTRIYTPGLNALGLARLSDIAPSVSNTVTKAYVEDLGIESGVDEQTVTNIAQSALGDFAATGTVANATDSEYCNSAAFANYADVADALESLTDTRTATQIFTQLDETASTNYANTAAANAVANADTTYRRTIGITNLNQSVQYVNITDPTPSTLAIQLPTDGATKDWMVYVTAVTNVSLALPSATWWMADVAYTNDVPPAKPTAFYFSQISTNIFYLGRQELMEVTAP